MADGDERHVDHDEPTHARREQPVGAVVPWERLRAVALRGVSVVR